MRLREYLSNFPSLLERALATQKAAPTTDILRKPTEPELRQALFHENRKLGPSELSELVAAYESGVSIKALGRRFGTHEQTARAHLERAGVQLRPRAVMTPEQLPDLVRRYESGASIRQLAEHFVISGGSVRNYLLRAGVTLRPARRMPRRDVG